MQVKIKQIFSILAILGVILNAFAGLFSQTAKAQARTAGDEYSFKTRNIALVKVVEQRPGENVVFIQTGGSQNQECKKANIARANLIQDAASLNLNQPAECFILDVGKMPYSDNVKLGVKPLSRILPSIAVVKVRNSAFSSNRLEPFAGLQNQKAVAPFAAFASVIKALALRGESGSVINRVPKIFYFSKNAFQILRC